jgi:DNA-directed RNA polymerase specialized sigma24 family protein
MDEASALHLKAFNAQVSEHQESLYNLAYRVLGDEGEAIEVTQAAIENAYRTLGSPPKGSVKLGLLRVLVRLCRQRVKRKSPSASQLSHDLAKCLASLPVEYCLAITLVDLEGLDYDQAAIVLQQPRRKVKQHLAQGRQMLSTHILQ